LSEIAPDDWSWRLDEGVAAGDHDGFLGQPVNGRASELPDNVD
jgi:hypothetical protein